MMSDLEVLVTRTNSDVSEDLAAIEYMQSDLAEALDSFKAKLNQIIEQAKPLSKYASHNIF